MTVHTMDANHYTADELATLRRIRTDIQVSTVNHNNDGMGRWASQMFGQSLDKARTRCGTNAGQLFVAQAWVAGFQAGGGERLSSLLGGRNDYIMAFISGAATGDSLSVFSTDEAQATRQCVNDWQRQLREIQRAHDNRFNRASRTHSANP